MGFLDLFKSPGKLQKAKQKSEQSDEALISDYLAATPPERELMISEIISSTGKMRLLFRLRKLAAAIRDREPPFTALYEFETKAMAGFSEGFVGKWAASLAWSSYFEERARPFVAEISDLNSRGRLTAEKTADLLARVEAQEGGEMPPLFVSEKLRKVSKELGDHFQPIEEIIRSIKQSSSEEDDLRRLKRSFRRHIKQLGNDGGENYILRIEQDQRLAIHAEALREMLKEKEQPNTPVERPALRENCNEAINQFKETKDKKELQKQIIAALNEEMSEESPKESLAIIDDLLADPQLDPIAAIVAGKIRENVIERYPEATENLDDYRHKVAQYEHNIEQSIEQLDSRIEITLNETDEGQSRAEAILEALNDPYLSDNQRERLLRELDSLDSLFGKIVRYIEESAKRLTKAELKAYLQRMLVDLKRQGDIVNKQPRIITYINSYIASLNEKPEQLLQRVHTALRAIRDRYPKNPNRAALEQLALLDQHLNEESYHSIHPTLLTIYRNILDGELSPQLLQKIRSARPADQVGLLKGIEATQHSQSNSVDPIIDEIQNGFDYKRCSKALQIQSSGGFADLRSVSRLLEKSATGEPIQQIKMMIRKQNSEELRNKLASEPSTPESVRKILSENAVTADIDLAVEEIQESEASAKHKELLLKTTHSVAKEKKILKPEQHKKMQQLFSDIKAITEPTASTTMASVTVTATPNITTTTTAEAKSELHPSSLDAILNAAVAQFDADTDLPELPPEPEVSPQNKNEDQKEDYESVEASKKPSPPRRVKKNTVKKSVDEAPSRPTASTASKQVTKEKKSQKKEEPKKEIDLKKSAAALERIFIESIPDSGKAKNIVAAVPTQSDLEGYLRERAELAKLTPEQRDEAVEKIRRQIAVSVPIPPELANTPAEATICIPKKIWLHEGRRKQLVAAFEEMAKEFPPGSTRQRYYSFVADEMAMNYYARKYK